MKLYKENSKTIVLSQCDDPLLNHLTSIIFSYLALSRGKKLLDIGCGVGRLALRASQCGFQVTGVDIERRAIKLARREAQELGLVEHCRFIHGDILKLKNLVHQRFDVIVCSEVIEHVSNPKAMVDSSFKLLKKEGLLILTTPYNPKFWSVLDDYAQHVKRFTLEEIKELLSSFKIIHLYTVGFPFMRSIIILYNLFARVRRISHTSVWRNRQLTNYLYSFLVGFLLKIDDLFNFLNRGTTIIAVAKK